MSVPLPSFVDVAPLILEPATILTVALNHLQTQQANCILVAQRDRRLLGIVTPQDILAQVSAQRDLTTLTLRQVMTSSPVTLQASQLHQQPLLLTRGFVQHGVHRFPVVDHQNVIVGLLDQTALLQAIAQWEMYDHNELRDHVDALVGDRTTTTFPINQLQTLRNKLNAEIAERQIVAQQLASSEQQLRVILASIMDAVFTIEMGKMGIQQMDIAPTHLSRSYGDRQHWLDQIVNAFFDESTAAQWHQPIWNCLATQTLTETDYELILDTGEQLWFAVRITPINAQRVVWVARDINDRKQAETALHAKNLELASTIDQLQKTQTELIDAEKLAVLGQLIASIAHEINTPLGVISSSIRYIQTFAQEQFWQWGTTWQQYDTSQRHQLRSLVKQAAHGSLLLSTRERRQRRKQLQQQLRDQGIENALAIAPLLVDLNQTEITDLVPLLGQSQAQEFLQVAYQLSTLQTSIVQITEATNRAAKIVKALRSYAHRDSITEFAAVDVVETMETVLTLYQNQLKHGIEVVRHYDPVLPQVWGDGDRLHQVWNNIIRNALQAMPQGGTLTIAIAATATQLHIQITDTGVGIPPAVLPRIFQPFFTTRSQGEGTGLGLDIAHQIVQQHQGDICATSQPGQTTFTIELPIAAQSDS